MLARACGKTNIHSLEPEDLAALTMESSAMAKVPLAGTDLTVGVDNYHSIIKEEMNNGNKEKNCKEKIFRVAFKEQNYSQEAKIQRLVIR